MWVVKWHFRGGNFTIEGPFDTKEQAEKHIEDNNTFDEKPELLEVDNLAGFETDPWELTWPEPKEK